MRRRLVWIQGAATVRNIFVIGDITWWNGITGWSGDTSSTRLMRAMIGANTKLYRSQEVLNLNVTKRTLSPGALDWMASIGVDVIVAPIADWEGFGFLEVPTSGAPFLTRQEEEALKSKMLQYGGILSVDIGRTTAEVDAYIAGLIGKNPIGPGTNVANIQQWQWNNDHAIFQDFPSPEVGSSFNNGGISSGFDRAANNIQSKDIIAESTRPGFEGAVLAFYIP